MLERLERGLIAKEARLAGRDRLDERRLCLWITFDNQFQIVVQVCATELGRQAGESAVDEIGLCVIPGDSAQRTGEGIDSVVLSGSEAQG